MIFQQVAVLKPQTTQRADHFHCKASALLYNVQQDSSTECTYLVQLIVEVNFASAEVAAQQRGVGSEDGGNIYTPSAQNHEPKASQPLVEVSNDVRFTWQSLVELCAIIKTL